MIRKHTEVPGSLAGLSGPHSHRLGSAAKSRGTRRFTDPLDEECSELGGGGAVSGENEAGTSLSSPLREIRKAEEIWSGWKNKD